jgi:mono/diheme cytochrome c family protein
MTMKSSWFGCLTAAAVVLCIAFGGVSSAQQPAGGRGAGRGAGPGDPQNPLPQVIPSSPPVDPAAHDQGRDLWARHCIDCHGTQARGSETGPNIIRSPIVNWDRTSFTPGSVLGPFLKKGHPTQSGTPLSALTDEQIVGLAHFLRQRVNDTMRGSPVFVPGDVLTGDAKAGEAFFNGEGGCATCHNAATRNLAGIRSRVASTVDLQQRMLFPMSPAGRGRGRGRGAASLTDAVNPNAQTVTISPASGPVLSGVLIEQDSFFVTFRDAAGSIQTVRRTPGMKVVTTHPLQGHIDLLDRLTDKNIHDLVAYLEALK